MVISARLAVESHTWRGKMDNWMIVAAMVVPVTALAVWAIYHTNKELNDPGESIHRYP